MSDPMVDPRGRQPFSYSWVILATGFCIMVLSSGLNMSFGVFVRTLINDYGWTTSIVTYGWKDSYIILGLMAWGIALSAFALLRNDPQDTGARPYGEEVDGADPSPAGRAPVLTGTPAKLWQFREIVRTRTFWELSIVHFACCVCHAIPLLHIVPYAEQVGLSKLSAAWILGISGVTSFAGRIF